MRVSIYMPAVRAGREVRQNAIRFRNQLREARKGLQTAGLKGAEAREFLAPAVRLLDDDSFWQHQSDGLALFLSEGGLRHFRVPLPFQETTTVGDRFTIKPLLRLFSGTGRFYLLALSQNDVRVYSGSRFAMRPLDLKGFPMSLPEALGYDSLEKQQQFHTRTPSRQGRRAAMFHGQGGAADAYKSFILKFFQMVDKSLNEFLADKEPPLVLAGTDLLTPIYREANHYPFLAEAEVRLNPGDLSDEELHDKAWEAVRPCMLETRNKHLAAFRELVSTGRVSTGLEEIVAAAQFGRVAVLFLPENVQRWGRLDIEKNIVRLEKKPGPGNTDLLDLAAVRTLLNGGTVHVLAKDEVPGPGPAAAILRY